MMDILQNSSTLWVAISFFLFVFVAFKLGRKSVLNALDNYSSEIKSEIDNAERLRVEAQELLAQYQRKQRDAETESAKILENAKQQAKQTQKAADAELKEAMARREEQLVERLKRMEENAIADIQNHAAQLAVQATREMIVQTIDADKNADINKSALDDLPKHLN